MSKVLAIYSGGLDSTVMLAKLNREGHWVEALSFDYGQRHRKELRHAADLAPMYAKAHVSVNLTGVGALLKGNSQTDQGVAVPEGHYTEETMKQTIVPNRNMMMLAVAGAMALSRGFDAVAFGAHSGDHAIYPDCRPAFLGAMAEAFEVMDDRRVYLWAPLLLLNKAEIAALGQELGVPMGMTWSCYKGETAHCGKCGTCVERREAFKLAGVHDYTVYQEAR